MTAFHQSPRNLPRGVETKIRRPPRITVGRRRLKEPVQLTRWDKPLERDAIIAVRIVSERSGLAWVLGPDGRCGWMAQSRLADVSVAVQEPAGEASHA